MVFFGSSFTGVPSSRCESVKEVCYVNLLHGQYKTWTADWEQGLGIKCGLWTEYKTRTRYKTRTTDCVYENSFRKVKLRERESGLAKTVVHLLVSHTNIPLAGHVVYSPQRHLEKKAILRMDKEGYTASQGN